MGISAFGASGIKPGVCTSTTRPTSPYAGQQIYETDTNLGYIWNGSSWVRIYTQPVTTKGDVATYSTVPDRLAVGSNNYVLTADSSAATGLKWDNPVGLQSITPTVTSSGGTAATVSTNAVIIGAGNTSITVTCFSSSFENYLIVGSNIDHTNGSALLYFRFSGISGGHYSSLSYLSYAGSSSNQVINGGNSMVIALTSRTNDGSFNLYAYGPNVANRKNVTFSMANEDYAGSGGGMVASGFQSTGFTIDASGGSFNSGTIRVYGLRN